ncbi:hypothetical protein HanIR_Chr12g0563631 [Helianthus annuus]|nr:hypothetical protein HanIR_Chr12g0563631 [Helianthus annuus]
MTISSQSLKHLTQKQLIHLTTFLHPNTPNYFITSHKHSNPNSQTPQTSTCNPKTEQLLNIIFYSEQPNTLYHHQKNNKPSFQKLQFHIKIKTLHTIITNQYKKPNKVNQFTYKHDW